MQAPKVLLGFHVKSGINHSLLMSTNLYKKCTHKKKLQVRFPKLQNIFMTIVLQSNNRFG